MEQLWTEFAQKEDLTVRLSNILQDYAFGPGVFRELLQNADDAGASRFALYADSMHYGQLQEGPTHGLLDARLSQWQGPAIMAFNDALFSEEDFKGICRVGASIKQSDHTKIGRYGLGFNATYHLTDVVSFVASERFCIFDPHRTHLPSNLPGLQIRLTDASRRQFCTQLAPFDHVLDVERSGRDSRSPCRAEGGTLFRLPLRTKELAAKSSISQQAHEFRDVVSLLEDFLAVAGEALLFLQSVEQIEIHVRDSDPCGQSWKSLGRVEIHAACLSTTEKLRKERQLLKTIELRNDEIEQDRKALRRGFAFSLALHGAAIPPRQGLHSDPEITAWLVVARAEPVEEVNQELERSDSKPQPSTAPAFRLGAVAVPLPVREDDEDGHGGGVEPQNADASGLFKGQAYCFLPLSLATGLPVHISANFAVTANRRDLWRRSDDEESSESNLRASWNEALLEKTCPKAYADALELLAAGLLTSRSPTQGKLPFKADNFIPEQVLLQVGRFRRLWSLWPSVSTGQFAAIPKHVNRELVARDACVFHAGDEIAEGACVSIFLPAKSSLLCSSRAFSLLKPELRSSIGRLSLAGRRRSLVQVPPDICEVLLETKGTAWLEPQSLANMLRGFDTRHMPLDEADALVEYILSPDGRGSLSLLHGLKLCPLSSGSLGTFLHRAGGDIPFEFLWAEDPDFKDLFPDRDFVDPASGTFGLLKSRIANSNLNIQILSEKSLPQLLANILPAIWRGKSQVALLNGKILIDHQPQEELHKTQAHGQKGQMKQKKQGYAAPKKVVMSGKQNKWLKNSRKQFATDGDSDYDDAGSDCDWKEPEEASEEGAQKAETRNTPAAVTVANAVEMDMAVRRCELLWKLVESFDKSNPSPVQLLRDLPCIPLLPQAAGVRLTSCNGAQRQHLLSVEDYTVEETKLLSDLGCFLARPGKKLRSALGIERASALDALLQVAGRMERLNPAGVPRIPDTRMLIGMKDMRLDVERARPLQRLVCSILLRSAMKKKDVEKAMALPIFETRGGKFAVPFSPGGSSIRAPSEEWDELLDAHFQDFVLNFDAEGDGGLLIRELGLQRGNLSEFLARFCAPRAGLFDQKLSLRFLEAVASLGSNLWKKNVQKDYVTIRTACEEAPIIVFSEPDSMRRRCSEFVDPDDVKVTTTMHLPQEYCNPVVLSVLRRAGLKTLTDEEVFLSAARHVEESSQGQATAKGEELLKQLASRFPSLKWSSRSFAALSRVRIFPAMAHHSGVNPPQEAGSERIAVSLDMPCTLFHHAPVAWTQLVLLHPDTFEKWPKPLLQRFGAIKDPPPLDVIVANLIEVARRWVSAGVTKRPEIESRQGVVVHHLAALNALRSRSHPTQNMVQHSLCKIVFLVLDDGSMTSPCETFAALHAGVSDEETDAGGHKPSMWSLPRYLRPYRRLLLGIAGPALQGVHELPAIHVQPPPQYSVPEFIQNSLNCPDLADVIFTLAHCDPVEQIYAHRLVLAASCEHFKATFSRYSEAVEPKCRLEMPIWVSARPLLWMLAYLYQGYDVARAQQVAFNLSNESSASIASRSASRAWKRWACREIDSEIGEDLCCLLRLSEYYELDHLKQWTESQLGKLLTPENLIALSTHAYFCNAAQLLKVSIYHLRQQYSELVGMEDWEDLEPAIKELVLADVTSEAGASKTSEDP